MSEKDFLCALSDLLDEKLDEKLDRILDEKLDRILDEKLDRMLDEKLDRILDKKFDEKFDKRFDEKLEPINARLKRLEISMDHIVIPRLQNIEACYITTFERYQKSVEEHESMKQDIAVLKMVVESHSEKLQQIS